MKLEAQSQISIYGLVHIHNHDGNHMWLTFWKCFSDYTPRWVDWDDDFMAVDTTPEYGLQIRLCNWIAWCAPSKSALVNDKLFWMSYRGRNRVGIGPKLCLIWSSGYSGQKHITVRYRPFFTSLALATSGTNLKLNLGHSLWHYSHVNAT